MTGADLTLTQAIACCFEKNEMLDGFVFRWCPMPYVPTAEAKFGEWVEEATRWKGSPQSDRGEGWQRAWWPDLRIKQAGRGLSVWLKATPAYFWWGRGENWDGDPCAGVYSWD